VSWKIETENPEGLKGTLPLPQRGDGSGAFLIKARRHENWKASNDKRIL